MPLNRSTIASPAKRVRLAGDTRDKIVMRSVVLFNRFGIANVSIGYIAADMKISPGNITYYFKRKQDLIHACLEVLQERLRIGLKRPSLNTASETSEYVVAGMKALWQFRFFFNGLAYILGRDRKMRQDYYKFRDWLINEVSLDLQRMIELKVFFLPEAPNSLYMLVNCILSQWLNWLRMLQIENPLASTPSKVALHDCAIQVWCTCQPYLEPHFGRDLMAAFNVTLSVKSDRPGKVDVTKVSAS